MSNSEFLVEAAKSFKDAFPIGSTLTSDKFGEWAEEIKALLPEGSSRMEYTAARNQFRMQLNTFALSKKWIKEESEIPFHIQFHPTEGLLFVFNPVDSAAYIKKDQDLKTEKQNYKTVKRIEKNLSAAEDSNMLHGEILAILLDLKKAKDTDMNFRIYLEAQKRTDREVAEISIQHNHQIAI